MRADLYFKASISVGIRFNVGKNERLRGKSITFDKLAPGTYEVEINRKRKTVQVPGPPELVRHRSDARPGEHGRE